tara:strand:+ start:7708 stop:8169 length:462 start_codon:yes stop_codon:yes gene_type:complete
MIKRIVSADEFCKVVDNVSSYLDLNEESNNYYYLVPNNGDALKKAFGHDRMLAYNVFVWANLNNSGKYDAAIIFIKDKSPKHGQEIFSEYIWLSANPKAGYKLFATAIKFAKNNGFEYISMGISEKSPKKDKVKKLYKRLGFIKTSECYIAKL